MTNKIPGAGATDFADLQELHDAGLLKEVGLKLLDLHRLRKCIAGGGIPSSPAVAVTNPTVRQTRQVTALSTTVVDIELPVVGPRKI